MTDLPAPAPLPKALRPETPVRKALHWAPLVMSLITLILYVQVSAQTAKTSSKQSDLAIKVAGESAARADLANQINSQLQAAFCELLVQVGNPSTLPSTPVGKENALKFRRSAAILSCPNQVYTIPDKLLASTE